MTMDASQFRRELLQISREMSEAQREFSNATASIDSWRGSIDAATKRQELLNQRLLLQERRVQAYSAYLRHLTDEQQRNNDKSAKTRREIERTTKDLENVTAQYQRYQRQLWEAQDVLSELVDKERRENSEVGRLTKTMREQEAALDSLVMEYQNAVAQFGRMSAEARTAENRMNSMNDELRETRSQLERMGSLDIRNRTQISPLQLFGIGTGSQIAADVIQGLFRGLARATEEAVREFIDFESAFAGVKRTVEGSEQDFKLLRGEIMHLGTELAMPVNEIADIAAIAGQMGIGVDQISEFTRVMIQLGDTTNVSAEEAGQSLAQLSNLLGLTADEYERMGSAIVQLGNEYPTTEQDIIDMSSRLAGMAGQVSMTASDVLGLANALAAVGLEAEMGGNTISKTLREMLMAVENNTSALALFASTADMSVSEFSELFRKDATQALSLFIEGLDDTARNGRSATQILRELGITETRQIDTLLRLSGNTGLLAESIQTANSAWDENIALARESAARYETTESRIEMMKNAWRNVAISIGDFFSPAIDVAIGLATDFADMLTGSEMASYDLEGELDVLIKTLDDYKKAQDAAANSTDITTKMMLTQASVAQVAAGSELANTTDKTFDNIDKNISKYNLAQQNRNEAELRFQRFLEDPSRNVLGFQSVDEILSYIRDMDVNATDQEKATNLIFQQMKGTYQMWIDNNSLMRKMVLETSDDFENITAGAMRIADFVTSGDLDMFDLEGYLTKLDDETEETMRALISNLSDSREEAISRVDWYISQYGKNEESLNTLLAQVRENMGEAQMSGELGSYQYALNVNQEKYILGYIEDLNKASHATQEFVSNTEKVPRVSDIIAEFRKDLANTQDYNLAMGITGDDAARDEMSDYQSVMRKLIEERSDYNDALKMGNLILEDAVALADEYDSYAMDYEGEDVDKMRDAMLSRLGLSGTMTNEVFREYLEQWMAANQELDAISEEYFSKFSEQLTKDKKQSEKTLDEIMAEYREANATLIANEKALGDLYDFDSEKTKLLESTLTQILNISPSMRPEDWDMYADAIARFLRVATGTDEGGDTPYDKLAGRYGAAQVLWEGMGGVAESQLPDYQKSLKSTLENIYNESFGLDWDSLTDEQKEEITKGRETLVEQIQQLEEDVVTELEKLGGEWDTLQIRIGNRSLVDPEMLEKYDQSLVSSLEALYREYLTIDPKILDETARANIEAIAEKYKELTGEEIKKEPEIEGNWWSRAKESANKAVVGEENWPGYQDMVAGIQELVGDISDVWNQLGGGILDTINMWFDAQLDAIDRMSQELEDRLEEYNQMIESEEQIRENALRRQLEEGSIDEEEYYRQSAQNKLDSEARKREAEQKTQALQEQLDEKRQAVEEKQFNAEKANSIAQVLISAAQGIAAAWTNPWSAPYITALIATMSAVQTGIIASQKYTPALAQGGIVSSPTTALIGEAGPEAVIPLKNNLEWIDVLAERISGILDSDMAIRTIDRYSVRDGERTEPLSQTQTFTQIINSPKALSRKEIYRDTRRLFSMVRRANEQ